ncbi:hypothetical protein Sango_0257700 [Sesamum angolense]|uniref:Reverse transcriptase Ty1/copia-type domain-containing protein n=1 Tax=Sesamum angolense TaxID=2727404 RepID=A0AAE1XH91_9LAMI|nr:hypothetical protein Sango_0257700 [Sesamum angolense]
MARALLFHASLPKKFWGESILTATYHINRLPSPFLNWNSPCEILHNKKPPLDHLKIFGCLCFAANVSPHKSKFDERNQRLILKLAQIQIGWRPWQRSLMLWKTTTPGSLQTYRQEGYWFKMGIQAQNESRWQCRKLDVNNAFLHGYLEEDVYMSPPEGYTKAMQGQSPHNHCLFVKRSDKHFLALLVYVDDILLISSSISDIDEVKAYLDRLFTIKDLGFAKYFHGLQLARSSHGLLITQTKYLTDILKDANLIDAKPFPPTSSRLQVLSG